MPILCVSEPNVKSPNSQLKIITFEVRLCFDIDISLNIDMDA